MPSGPNDATSTSPGSAGQIEVAVPVLQVMPPVSPSPAARRALASQVNAVIGSPRMSAPVPSRTSSPLRSSVTSTVGRSMSRQSTVPSPTITAPSVPLSAITDQTSWLIQSSMCPATTSMAAWTEPTAAATSSRVYGRSRAGRSCARRKANSHSITIGG